MKGRCDRHGLCDLHMDAPRDPSKCPDLCDFGDCQATYTVSIVVDSGEGGFCTAHAVQGLNQLLSAQ